MSTWIVTFATTEKHFSLKADAVRYLNSRTAGALGPSKCARRCCGAYIFLRPVFEDFTFTANIDRVAFVSFKKRQRFTRR